MTRAADQDEPFQSDLATDLRIVLSKLVARLRAESGSDRLTSSQKLVLLHIETVGAASVSGLAKAAGVRPQSMGATVALLEAAQLVRSDPDPEDGRRALLSLTPTCRSMLAHFRAAKDDWLHRTIDANLNHAEQAELVRAVRLIGRLLD